MPRRNRNAAQATWVRPVGLVAVRGPRGKLTWRTASATEQASSLWSPIDELLYGAWRGRSSASDVTGGAHQPPTAEQRAAAGTVAAAGASVTYSDDHPSPLLSSARPVRHSPDG